MLIEIKGVQFVNKGAELMLFAILDKIKEYWPNADICMETDQNSPYIKRAKIGAYQKMRLVKNRLDVNGITYFLPKRFRELLKKTWGIVTEADVDVILDASGFAYGDQWGYLRLKQNASIAARFKRKGKSFILMSQAFGPFSTARSASAAKMLFDSSTFVFVRDDESLMFIKQCESLNIPIKSPDFTNLLIAKPIDEYKTLIDGVAIIPNCKMISESNPDLMWKKNYISILKMFIDELQARNQPVFLLNHEGEGDENICHQINLQLSKKVEVVSPINSIEVKSIIGSCQWVLSSRFHGCVSALSQRVPCLGTSWSHKYGELFKDYRHPSWLLNANLSQAEIIEIIDDQIVNNQTYRNSLNLPAEEYKNAAQEMWVRVKGSIQNSD